MLEEGTARNDFTTLSLEDNREFEWSNDLYILETLLDLARLFKVSARFGNIAIYKPKSKLDAGGDESK